jgi:hypothetical protein
VSGLAELSFRLSAAYDLVRLSLYRDKGARGHLISIASQGSLTLLRYEDVGYFNRVYAPDDDAAGRLESIEGFFSGSTSGRDRSAESLPRPRLYQRSGAPRPGGSYRNRTAPCS